MTQAPVDIRSLAEDVFLSPEKADHWLNSPLAILGGKSPRGLAGSREGAAFVAQMLAKIDWGAAA